MRILLIIFLTFTGAFPVTISCQIKDNKGLSVDSEPMYGQGIKNEEQLAADKIFLKMCDSLYSSREMASNIHEDWGWECIQDEDNATALKRFNQAWLLDSLNSGVYWGFGVLKYNDLQPKEALHFFKRAGSLDPENAVLWYWMALCCQRLYVETGKKKHLELKEEYLQMAEKFDTETNYRGRTD